MYTTWTRCENTAFRLQRMIGEHPLSAV